MEKLATKGQRSRVEGGFGGGGEGFVWVMGYKLIFLKRDPLACTAVRIGDVVYGRKHEASKCLAHWGLIPRTGPTFLP